MISRQAQHGLTFNPLADKKKQKFSEDSDSQLAVIETLPDIGAAIAMAILKEFGTLKGVFNASKKKLMLVDGIGEKRAEKLLEFINKRYDQ
jgi:ERCC4-type nuclease